MQLSRLTPCQDIVIWQPRWRDKRVLVAAHNVGTHNQITFTKAPTYPDTYYASGDVIRDCPLDTNGKINCYAVPIDRLEILERI